MLFGNACCQVFSKFLSLLLFSSFIFSLFIQFHSKFSFQSFFVSLFFLASFQLFFFMIFAKISYLSSPIFRHVFSLFFSISFLLNLLSLLCLSLYLSVHSSASLQHFFFFSLLLRLPPLFPPHFFYPIPLFFFYRNSVQKPRKQKNPGNIERYLLTRFAKVEMRSKVKCTERATHPLLIEFGAGRSLPFTLQHIMYLFLCLLYIACVGCLLRTLMYFLHVGLCS